MGESEEDIVQKLGNILKSKGVDYLSNVIVGESRPDLFFIAPNGFSYVVEVKSWKATPQNQDRASNLSNLYVNTSGSTDAFVVLPDKFKSSLESRVISFDEFPAIIDKILESKVNYVQNKPPRVRPKPDKFIFVAMPFSGEYDDTFQVAIQPSALDAGVDAIRVDYASITGDVVASIKHLICQSIAMVADLSRSRPNVLYEMGYAEALNRRIIQICSTPLKDLPFDVRNNNTIQYKIGQSAKLKKTLTKELLGIIQ